MRVIILILVCFFAGKILAQNDVAPRLMVIPFAKENEDMRTVMEKDSLGHLRVAMARVAETFDSTNFVTIDLQGFLRQMSNDRIITHNHQSFPKSTVLHFAQIEFYVEVEAQIIKTPRGNSVTIILNSYDAFSGQSLANGIGHSSKFYTQNFEKLSQKALDTFLEDFAKTTVESFEYLEKNGRPLALKIGLEERTDIDLDSYLNDDEKSISEEIEKWLEENTIENAFKIHGMTSEYMMVHSIRIPESLVEKNFVNYPILFAQKFKKFLIAKGLTPKFVVQGTNIFVTLM